MIFSINSIYHNFLNIIKFIYIFLILRITIFINFGTLASQFKHSVNYSDVLPTKRTSTFFHINIPQFKAFSVKRVDSLILILIFLLLFFF